MSDSNPSPGASSASVSSHDEQRQMPMPWLGDLRFQFSNNAMQNIDGILRNVNHAAQGHPEIISQLRTQLESITETLHHFNHDTSNETTTPDPTPINNTSSNPPPQVAGPSHQATTPPGVQPQQQTARSQSSHVAIDLQGVQQMGMLESFHLGLRDGAMFLEQTPMSDEEEEETDEESSLQPLTDGQTATAAQQAANGGNQQQQQQVLNEDIQRLIQLLRSPELQRVWKVALALLPYVLLFTFKFLIDHAAVLTTLILAVIVFLIADSSLKRFFTVQCFFAGVRAVVFPSLWLLLVYGWLFRDEQPWLALVLQPPPPWRLHMDLCSTIWLLVATDFAAKFLFMLAKVVVASVPGGSRRLIDMKRKRRLVQWLELTGQFYRFMLPIPIVFAYLTANHHSSGEHHLEEQNAGGVSSTLCWLLGAAYVLLKGSEGICVARDWWRKSVELWSSHAYGVAPTDSELGTLQEGGCPICFTDVKAPLKLKCAHIFCEECISTWLDKERTCPLCRQVVVRNDNRWKDGGTCWRPSLF